MKTKPKIDITNTDQSYWEKILVQEGFSMKRASLGSPDDRDAVLEYLERTTIQAVPVSELPDSFSTSDELASRYIAENNEGSVEEKESEENFDTEESPDIED